MASVLEGLRVLDFTRGMAGALVTMILADYGAEVVKVEPPGGDPLRGRPPFLIWHRGKKSIVLDLNRPDGRAHAAQLAAAADILVHNFRRPAAERFGLTYPALAAANPGLIFCRIGGLGITGRYADIKGYEGIVAAKIGALQPYPALSGRPGPVYISSPTGCYSGAQVALHGILAALYERQRSGLGQEVQTSLLHGATCYDPWEALIQHLLKLYGEAYHAVPPSTPSGVPMQAYAYSLLVACTKDGHWIQFANARPHMWRAFLRALDLLWVFDDPEFKEPLSILPPTGPDFVEEAVARRFWELLLGRMRERTLAEWLEIFLRDKDIGFEVFYSTQTAFEHPQYRISKQIVEFDDPRVGRMAQLGPIAVMDETPARVGRPAPELGAHTEEVLRSWKPRTRTEYGVQSVASRETTSHSVTRTSNSQGPLAGVTVLELATYFAAPFGLTLLADLGARVIKVEPLSGDPIRMAMRIPESGGVRVTQGKESLAADLNTTEGRAIVYALAKQVDLVMCNWREGVARKLQVDDVHLRAINPNLVYLYGTSYGTEGPYAARPAYAHNATAASGQAILQAGGVALPPPAALVDLEAVKRAATKLRVANGLQANGDSTAALGVATGMLLGLIARERMGIAQRLVTTMIGTNGYLMSDDFLRYAGKPDRPAPDAQLYGLGPTYRLYEAKEGWVFLACPQPKEWLALCAALTEATEGRVDLCSYGRRTLDYGSYRPSSEEDDALAAALAAVFRERTAAEWEAFLLARDIACVEVSSQRYAEFLNEGAILKENDLIKEVEHPIFGPHPRIGLTVALSRTPGAVAPAPTIGQHTRAILTELGYSPERIEELKARQIIGEQT